MVGSEQQRDDAAVECRQTRKETPMQTIVSETPIARSADEVFDHLRDHSNQLEWQAGNVKSVAVEPPGPSAAGTRIHQTRRTPMGDLSFTEEVIDLSHQPFGASSRE